MVDQMSNQSSLRRSLTLCEETYHSFRLGRASLEDVFSSLDQFLRELEQSRLEQPKAVPVVSFLGRYDVYETAVALAYSLGRVRDAFAYAERARARGLLDQTLNKLPLNPKHLTDSELLQKEARLKKQVQELSRNWYKADLQPHVVAGSAGEAAQAPGDSMHSPIETDLEAALRQARAELKSVQDAIRQQDPAFAALRGVAPADADDAKALLDGESALLSYCVTEERVIIFIVTSQGLYSEHINIPYPRLSQLVVSYRSGIEWFAAQSRDFVLERRAGLAERAVSAEEAELEALARRLYDILIRPAEPHLRGRSRLGIIPHRDLHRLPFQALRDERGYLIERYALWYAPSISLLDLCYQRHRRSRGRLLAMGDPDLGNLEPRLRFAAQEVSDIAALFNADPYLGAEANLAALRQHWEQSDVLHLACHALFDAQRPEFSALLLTPGVGDTGRLEVQELFALDHDLPLSQVTLSACHTSLGAGNDLTGLATGFLYAGVPAVVASLWRVDDLSTSELMVKFYQELMSSDRATALRDAQLSLLHSPEHAHPYFWAGFKLTGTPVPMESDRTYSTSAFHFIHRWTYRSEEGTLGDPWIAGDRLYATWSGPVEDDASEWEKAARPRAINAVSLSDRQLCWRKQLSEWGRAYCWVPGLVHVKTTEGVAAWREADGEVVWEHATGGHFPPSLRFDGHWLYVGTRARSVLALRPDTGEVMWEYTLPRPGSGGFAVGDGRVYVGCNDHHLYAIASRDGGLRWKCDLGFANWEGGVSWVSAGRLRTTLGDFDVETGEIDRGSRLDENERVVAGNRLLLDKVSELPRGRGLYFKETYVYRDDDLVFTVNAQDRDVYLSLFDAADGNLLRRYGLGRNGMNGFYRQGDLVVAGFGDGSLYGFSIEKTKKETS